MSVLYVLDGVHPNTLITSIQNHPLPLRVTSVAFGQVPNTLISASDRSKYDWAVAELKRSRLRYGRYINAQHARVSDPDHKYPDNALDAALLPERMFFGPARPYSTNRPKLIIRRYTLVAEQARSELAQSIYREYAHFPDQDLFLDGIVVPELVDSSVPWRFTHVCDLIAKIRMLMPAWSEEDKTGGDIGINLSGACADLTHKMMSQMIDSGVRYVTFEQSGAATRFRDCVQSCGYMLKRGCLPILLETGDGQTDATNRDVCEVSGAAMGF